MHYGVIELYRVSTGANPFSLTNGMEVVLPIELEIPSLQVALENQVNEIEWVQARYNELALLDEKRLKVAYHHQVLEDNRSGL